MNLLANHTRTAMVESYFNRPGRWHRPSTVNKHEPDAEDAVNLKRGAVVPQHNSNPWGAWIITWFLVPIGSCTAAGYYPSLAWRSLPSLPWTNNPSAQPNGNINQPKWRMVKAAVLSWFTWRVRPPEISLICSWINMLSVALISVGLLNTGIYHSHLKLCFTLAEFPCTPCFNLVILEEAKMVVWALETWKHVSFCRQNPNNIFYHLKYYIVWKGGRTVTLHAQRFCHL